MEVFSLYLTITIFACIRPFLPLFTEIDFSILVLILSFFTRLHFVAPRNSIVRSQLEVNKSG